HSQIDNVHVLASLNTPRKRLIFHGAGVACAMKNQSFFESRSRTKLKPAAWCGWYPRQPFQNLTEFADALFWKLGFL
ncbi:MAG: hypothetical protein AAFW66_16825, partial [Pseudomonadota bacterium]